MKPDKTSAIALFSAPVQYLVPVFQRGYVWTLEKQVAPLWNDIEDRATAWLERKNLAAVNPGIQLAKFHKHFLGSVVLTPVTNGFGRVPTYEVIDGQQRTTTLHLLLLAFKHAATKVEDPLTCQMLSSLIENKSPFNVGPDKYKVWPTKAGRDEICFLNEAADLEAICKEYPVKTGKKYIERPLMVQAFLYLYNAILAFLANVSLSDPQSSDSESYLSDALTHSIRKDNIPTLNIDISEIVSGRAEALYMALDQALQVMTLTLEEEDDPQVIFETLNARGAPLLSSDLVRNFLFLEASRAKKDVGALYEKYWKDFDEQIDKNNKVIANQYWREKERSGRITYPRIDLFFFYYMVFKTRQEIKISHVFQSFKEWWQMNTRVLEAELEDIILTSRLFRDLITPIDNTELAEFARLIKSLDVSTITPVYIYLRSYYKTEDSSQLLSAVRDLSSYLVRRAVCGYTTKGYNKIFLKILDGISGEEVPDPSEKLRSILLELNGHSQCWPSDKDFEEHWINRPVYKELRPGKTAAILRALEVNGRTSWQESDVVCTVDKLTVEHVLPQKWEKEGHYPLSSNTEESRLIRGQLLNTFGNLTLLTQGLNSSTSNGPFLDFKSEKDAIIDGKRTKICQQSVLQMNSYFHNKDKWDDSEIVQRSKALFKQAVKLWYHPEI